MQHILLLTFDEALVEAYDEHLSLLRPSPPFDIGYIAGFRFEDVLIDWSALAKHRPGLDAEETDLLRRELVDWVNTEVSPRIISRRRPIWL